MMSSNKAPLADNALERAQDAPLLSKAEGVEAEGVESEPAQSSGLSDDDVVNGLMQLVSPGGLDRNKDMVKRIGDAVGPVLQHFDTVLGQPYLITQSASLNTAPVVGIKDGQVWYVATKGLTSGSIAESWEVFSDLPPEAKALNSDKMFLFPYNGDFYLAVDKSVWKKTQRLDREDRKKAFSSWPLLYKDWEKVGDNILPATNIKSITPFIAISANKTSTKSYLVFLKSDGSMVAKIGDDLVNASILHLTVKPDTEETEKVFSTPRWSHITYWNNMIVGYDDTHAMYDIKVEFPSGQYTFGNKRINAAITELTASDFGVVVARSDEYLYKNVINVSDGSEATLDWKQWIKHKDIKHLGVASPSVILDMHLLISTLRSRYVDVQVSFYPVTTKLRGYAGVHSSYITQLRKVSAKYKSTTDPAKKRELAIEQAETFIEQAEYWSSAINKLIVQSEGTIENMNDQLAKIQDELKVQMTQMKAKLDELEKVLKSQKGVLSGLRATFWAKASMAATGAAYFACGLFTLNLDKVKEGGSLFMAGLGASVSEGMKKADMEKAMSYTRSGTEQVRDAHATLEKIVNSYVSVREMYSKLDNYWKSMSDYSQGLTDKGEDFLVEFGRRLFEIADSDLETVAADNSAIREACDKYLDILHTQGITIPSGR